MKYWSAAAAILLGIGATTLQSQTAPLTSLKEIHQLTNEQASGHLPVDFEATVTYYRSYEGTMFVQDGHAAIYVRPPSEVKAVPGDRIRIHGTTRESFRPFVAADSISVIGQVPGLNAVAATYDGLIHARFDCQMVSIRGHVLSADITLSVDRPSTTLELLTDGGGEIEVQLESDNPDALEGLLDAEVEVTGAASGRFDGKMQMTGVVLHTQTLDQVKVLKAAKSSPWALPATPMDEVYSGYAQSNLTRRLRVEGVITFYIPGAAVVLQNGTRSLWINTRTRTELHVGDWVNATGFPDVHDGFLKLADSEIRDNHKYAPVEPYRVTLQDLTQSHHVFDLVSIEAEVVEEVREAGQDEYVLRSQGEIFSAIYRHPPLISMNQAPLPPMKEVPVGSRVRVTGICTLEDSNPFNANVPFDLLLRSFDDIDVVARPSLLTVGNLVRLVSLLMLLVLGVSTWGWMLNRKVRRQTAVLASRIEAEAALERRHAQIEQRRGRILEDINGSRPLAEVLEEITELVSFRLVGAFCWCEVADGAKLGAFQAKADGLRVVREKIPAREGAPLGELCVALDAASEPSPDEGPALFQGTRLATLAIETRRVYTDLVHRSEFDLLTDAHNRFSLDKQFDEMIVRAREHAGNFGLIYVDLDDFKQVNDIYGHHIGDLYLQEAAARMKHQMRGGDIFARLGGDEFAALVPGARSRSGVEEIALRLERCFAEPFHLDGHVIRGTASVGVAMYPEDGGTKDSLLMAADAAMYVSKHMRRES
jgi:diguanylate cyclase (GGDEF)-like protein